MQQRNFISHYKQVVEGAGDEPNAERNSTSIDSVLAARATWDKTCLLRSSLRSYNIDRSFQWDERKVFLASEKELYPDAEQ
ncbi:unnamed protein product [Clavelina lepadiformis]|uniref:Uncharacterized protein n=1 Tax=Clavelina lepadiformis TaxID=159417 RepID=A0ABP0FQU8_CLALP